MKMTKLELQYRLGLLLVGSHVWLIALLLIFPLISRITFEQILPVMSVILPVFGVYVGAVVEFSISNRYVTSRKSVPVNPMFAMLALSIPIGFVLAVIAIIFLWGFNETINSQVFHNFFTLLESGLGGFVGFFVTALFREGQLEDEEEDDGILTHT